MLRAAIAAGARSRSNPAAARLARRLAEYEDLPHAQIASILKCTPKAVENYLYRARAHLRQRLARLLQPA